MKYILIIIFIVEINTAVGKDKKNNKEIDSLYLEDQLYVDLSYNVLINKNFISNKPINQGLFSNTISIGYVRDIPLNFERNIGLGVGLGFNFSDYYSNIKIINTPNGDIDTDIIDEVQTYNNNKLSVIQIDFPIEFRYRTSTFEDKDFYRFYFGMVFSYVISEYVKYKDSKIDVRYYGINAANKFQYGLTFLFGRGNWNGFIFYNLSNIYSSSLKIDNQNILLRNINLGIRYYIF